MSCEILVRNSVGYNCTLHSACVSVLSFVIHTMLTSLSCIVVRNVRNPHNLDERL